MQMVYTNTLTTVDGCNASTETIRVRVRLSQPLGGRTVEVNGNRVSLGVSNPPPPPVVDVVATEAGGK